METPATLRCLLYASYEISRLPFGGVVLRTRPGHPGGMQESSRGLRSQQRTLPPEHRLKSPAPWRAARIEFPTAGPEFWHPSRVHELTLLLTGGLRAAQTSGYYLATRRVAGGIGHWCKCAGGLTCQGCLCEYVYDRQRKATGVSSLAR